MNSQSAAEAIAGVIARAVAPACLAAHLISERDMDLLHDVARWLASGATERGYAMSGDLPTVNIDQLQHLAVRQAAAKYPTKRAAIEAVGVSKPTFYRWLKEQEPVGIPPNGRHGGPDPNERSLP